MRLRRNQYCPVHKSLSCCGRELIPNKPRLIRLGVQRVEDPHHPRGYRELRSPAEMRKLLNRKIVEQDRKCAICHEEFTNYNDIVPDHRTQKEWAELGAMITQRISRQHISGAMKKKDQPEWTIDGRSVGAVSNFLNLSIAEILRLAGHSHRGAILSKSMCPLPSANREGGFSGGGCSVVRTRPTICLGDSQAAAVQPFLIFLNELRLTPLVVMGRDLTPVVRL